jgi:RHS repeat-associated protein
LAEYNVYGVCVRDYTYMGTRLIAEYDPLTAAYYYYTSDQINSTRIVTDDSGAAVYAAAHDPYGGIQKTWVNTFDPPLKFSGKERDGESGLDYFGDRYYDGTQYRFISPDPAVHRVIYVGDPQAWNYYSYWAHVEFGDIDKAGRMSLVAQVVESYRSVNRWEGPNAHTSVRKELYPTPNLADQSGDPTKPGLAYQMKLDDLYQSKLKEFEWKLWGLDYLFGFKFDIVREAEKLRWLYFAWNDIVIAPNDVEYLSGRSNYKETNSFMELFLFTSGDFPEVPGPKDY